MGRMNFQGQRLLLPPSSPTLLPPAGEGREVIAARFTL